MSQDKKIADICEVNHSSINDDNFDMDKIEYVDISSTGQGKIESTKTYKASEAPSRAKRVVKDGDVIISRVRPGRKQYAFVRNSPDNLVVSTGFIVLRPKEDEEIHPEYLYYATTSDKFMNEMERRKTGSTYPSTNISEVKSMRISVPEYQQQLNIVNTLSPIDRKIELNRELAELLEETAHAIYESWFEAYEPYDIPDGQEFPADFKEEKLDGLGKIVTGSTPSTDEDTYYGGKFPFVKVSDIENGVFVNDTEVCLTEDGKEEVESRIIPKNSTMMTCIGSIGKIALSIEDTVTNQQINSIVPETDFDSEYIYFTLDSMSEELQRKAGGSVQQIMSKSEFSNLNFIMADQKSRKRYHKITSDMFARIETIKRENSQLQELRDYLLPQLLSGEVIIQDDEREPEQEDSGSD